MSELRELYQQLVLDHGRNPRNFKKLNNANHVKDGFNPLCGDKITLYIFEKDNIIKEVSFQGSGCAISMASASLMTEAIKGKTMEEAELLFNDFHELVTGNNRHDMVEEMGKLAVLSGVSEFPMRIKCATLSWHALEAIIHNKSGKISTEQKNHNNDLTT